MMDQTKNRQRILLSAALVAIILISIIAWILREPLQEYVVEPTASRVWWWWNFSRMLFPQSELWILLILLGGLRLTWFAARRTRLQFPATPVPQKSGRVGYWLDLLNLGHRAQRLFMKPFRFLTVDVIAEEEQEERKEIFSRLYAQTLSFPFHLQIYLNTGKTRGRSGADKPPPEAKSNLDPEIEDIIIELETLMELPHDV